MFGRHKESADHYVHYFLIVAMAQRAMDEEFGEEHGEIFQALLNAMFSRYVAHTEGLTSDKLTSEVIGEMANLHGLFTNLLMTGREVE